MRQVVVLVLVFSGCLGANSGGSERGQDDGKKQAFLVPLEGNEFSPDFQYNVNFLEPQFQYPPPPPPQLGFNYVPNKQPSFARSQPPVIVFAGAAPPGQQFLLQQPGAPPGNFLIPQPEGPNVILRGNPNQQNPGGFVGAYPKPSYVPPIEKDAEEIPNLAGNHPSPPFAAKRPEKLETLDEPQLPPSNEADDLAAGVKYPGLFPKKFPAPQPKLKPGERFFILNGRPLYSNYPVAPNVQPQYQPQYQPHIQQYQPQIQQYQPQIQQYQPLVGPHQPLGSHPDLFYLRSQPQFISPSHQNNYQDLFLRNGEISDVRFLPSGSTLDKGNIIALNQAEDFRQPGFLVRAAVPTGVLEPDNKNSKLRLGKNVQFVAQPVVPAIPFLTGYGGFEGGYYLADLKNFKDEDDTVVIDAKTQEVEADAIKSPVKKDDEESGSLAQAQPSAVAIAGIGGVASAGPRGTALAGHKGLAVSSPQATVVAGSKDEDEENVKDKKTKPKKPSTK